MNKITPYLILLLLAFIPACQKEETAVILINLSDYPLTEKLESKKLPLEILNPFDLLFVDNKYMLQDQQRDTVFTLIDASTLKRDTLFGLRGKGPNEFNNMFIFGRNNTNHSSILRGFNTIDKKFYDLNFKYDNNERKLEYNLSSASNSMEHLPNIFQDLTFLDNEHSIAYTDDVNKKIYIMDIDKGTISHFADFSNEEKKILAAFDGAYKVSVLNSAVGYNNKRIVFSSNCLGYIEMFDLELKTIKKVSIDGTMEEKVQKYLSDINEPILYTLDMALTDDKIYVLYFNERLNRLTAMEDNISCKVLVFDYDLELERVLHLNHFISKIAVNEAKKEILGIEVAQEGYQLRSFLF